MRATRRAICYTQKVRQLFRAKLAFCIWFERWSKIGINLTNANYLNYENKTATAAELQVRAL